MQYLIQSLKLLIKPSQWKTGEAQMQLHQELSEYFHASVTLFSSGREALHALLQAGSIGKGDEVIVQAYTCVVVPNAIRATGATPIFADIERETLNLDVHDVEQKITPNTKAIICQHTFGIPADLKVLRSLCDTHRILLIEDCAHSIEKPLGTIGDAAMLSFGRDKALSAIQGGAAIAHNPKLHCSKPKHQLSQSTIGRLLFYPLLYSIAKCMPLWLLGKTWLYGCKTFSLLVPVVTSTEKHGTMHRRKHELPNALAQIALEQWKKLPKINAHRKTLTKLYKQHLPSIHDNVEQWPLQKYPLYVQHADSLRMTLKRKGMHLDDGWTRSTICPRDSAIDRPTTTPVADEISQAILSLPTHPTMTEQQADTLCKEIVKGLKASKI